MAMDEKLGVKSKEAYRISLGNIGIVSPVEIFSDAPYPSAGLWFHRFALTRGEKKRVYNVYFMATENREPQMLSMIMGTTLTSITLARDVLKEVYAKVYVRNNKKGWGEAFFKENVVVAHSEVIEQPHTIEYEGRTVNESWTEKWIVRVVDTDTPVVIRFVPRQAGGTDYVILTEEDATTLLFRLNKL